MNFDMTFVEFFDLGEASWIDKYNMNLNKTNIWIHIWNSDNDFYFKQYWISMNIHKRITTEYEYWITNLNNEIIHYKVRLQKDKRKYLNYIFISSLDLEFPAKTK